MTSCEETVSSEYTRIYLGPSDRNVFIIRWMYSFVLHFFGHPDRHYIIERLKNITVNASFWMDGWVDGRKPCLWCPTWKQQKNASKYNPDFKTEAIFTTFRLFALVQRLLRILQYWRFFSPLVRFFIFPHWKDQSKLVWISTNHKSSACYLTCEKALLHTKWIIVGSSFS